MAFTWSNGRQLATITQNNNALATYTYNSDGLRTSKTVNGTTTNYYWANGILQGQKTGSEYMLFLYDENGNKYGFLLKNGTTEQYYYYIFNLQGDVIGIVDSTGNTVVEYTYGAWGDLLTVTGTLASTIGQTNPIRYRGYYYDAETGFYYLQSRFYDPESGRFINADGYVSTGQGILATNMYAYCGNNPVNMTDPSGMSFVSAIKDIINVFVQSVSEFVRTVSVYIELNRMGFNNITYQSAKDCSNAMKKSEINTIQEKAHFLSQCYVEGNISLLEAGYLPEERAENYRKNQPYYPYYGAGYIQITWDYNYKAFSEYMGDPRIYEEGPKYVAKNYAWSAAGWFWTKNHINDAIASGASVKEITRIINGGYNKLSERINVYNSFLQILGG